MTNQPPTPEQLEEAAELAPKLNQALGLPIDTNGMLKVPQDVSLFSIHILDPRAFAAVVAGLPKGAVNGAMTAAIESWQSDLDASLKLDFLQWLLTSTGMLAFYREVVRLGRENDGQV